MKKNELYTEKHGNLNLLLHFRTPKGINFKKKCPLVLLYIPIWRSYNRVLLDFFREKKDIPDIKYNY